MSRFHFRYASSLVVGILVIIGCGSGPPAGAANEGRAGKPQDASATTDSATQPATPTQVAQAPAGTQPVAAANPHSAAASGSASVKGMVRLDGTASERKKINRLMAETDPVCTHSEPVLPEGQFTDLNGTMYSDGVAVNANGTLKNVFVYVKQGLQGTFPAPAEPVVLDQSGCLYHPHVFGIQVNQPLDIVNSDATEHNVNATPASNPRFNIGQPKQGMRMTKKFTKPEVTVPFKCNVHPWMNAYAGVVEHPFYSVTGEDGSFAITGLPAGTYVVEAWHEKYGTQTQTVSIADGESKSIELTFKAK